MASQHLRCNLADWLGSYKPLALAMGLLTVSPLNVLPVNQ